VRLKIKIVRLRRNKNYLLRFKITDSNHANNFVFFRGSQKDIEEIQRKRNRYENAVGTKKTRTQQY
jgi:hypothetical protein